MATGTRQCTNCGFENLAIAKSRANCGRSLGDGTGSEVKGKTAPVRVWEAVAPLSERQEARRVAAPLIGRQDELALLRHIYERTRTEALVHHITVLGQPGVGKSRLLREFLGGLQDADPRPAVLRGRSLARRRRTSGARRISRGP